MRNYFNLFIFFLFTLFLFSCKTTYDRDKFKVKNGVLDLTELPEKSDFKIALNGDWEFYWEQLLSPKDFENENQISPKYFKVPRTWKRVYQSNSEYSLTGYVTYRMKIIYHDNGRDIAMRLPLIRSAYKIWVNGKLLSSVGNVAIDKENEHSFMGKKTIYFKLKKENEIIVQVSNFHTILPGIWHEITIGSVEEINKSTKLLLFLNIFVFGVLFIMSFYHFSLFMLRRESKENLFFSIFLFMIAIRNLIINESYLSDILSLLIPLNNYAYFSEWFYTFLAIPIYFSFLSLLYPGYINKKILNIYYYFASFLVIISMFSPIAFAAKLSFLGLFIYPLASLYNLYICIRLVLNKEESAKLFLGGLIFRLSVGFADVLLLSKFANLSLGISLHPFGIVVFVLVQSIIISKKFSNAFRKVEHLSAEMEKANINLQNMDKLKDQFLANTSHELRTPLNGIIGLAESVIDKMKEKIPDNETLYNLKTIKHSGKRLATLINDILDVSKLKHKTIHLEQKPLSIKKIIRSVTALTSSMLKGKPVEIKTEIDENISSVYVDENRIMQIFYNLIGNAIKFTNEGIILIKAEEKNDLIEVSISDTGIGVPENRITEIFESFEQVDSSTDRKYGGTGLGLFITKQLVELHGGNIECISELGKGSTFTFTLPKSIEKAKDFDSTDELSKVFNEEEYFAFESSNSNNKYQIVFVDDEPVNHQVVSNFLSDEKYSLMNFYSGKSFLEVFNNNDLPDLILLDIMMPEMSGYAVCQQIRKHYEQHEIPVIMLTAKNRTKDLAEGFFHGANDYITKPFSKNELIARIEAHISIKEKIDFEKRDYELLLEEKDSEIREIERVETAKYGRSRLDDSLIDKLAEEIEHIVVKDKGFTDPEISRINLSEKLNITQIELSQVINRKFDLTFSAYINSFRVKEILKILKHKNSKNKTLLEIGKTVGFNNKVSFNANFKKFTGMTPSQFKKSLSS